MVETKLSLQNVTRDDWLRLRKSGLGGSDAGAVCGLNPYSSPLQVFCDKTTEEGNRLPPASIAFEKATILIVIELECLFHGRNRKEGTALKFYVPFRGTSLHDCRCGSVNCWRRCRIGMQNCQCLQCRQMERWQNPRSLHYPVLPLYGCNRKKELVHCCRYFRAGI